MQLVIYGSLGPCPFSGLLPELPSSVGSCQAWQEGQGVSELFWLWVVLLPAWLSPGNNSPCREAPCARPSSV